MAPVSQNNPNLKLFTTSNNANIGEPDTLRVPLIRGGTKTVKGLGDAEKFSFNTPTFATLNHAKENTNFFTRNSPRSLHLLATHNDNYKATSSTGTMQNCNGACVSVAVVISLVLFCMSIGLFVSLFSRCGKIINGWWNNYTRRRTSSQVIATVNSTRSIELSPLPPYSENTLPTYSESIVPTINTSPNPGSQIDDQTSDQSDTALTGSATCTHTSTTSSSETYEIPVPSAPFIPTIPLPPVENEIDGSFPFRSSSDSEMMDELQARRRMVDSPNNQNISSVLNSNRNLRTVGILGLIFEDRLSDNAEAPCLEDADSNDSVYPTEVAL